MKYPTIRIEGAILAADILDKIEKSNSITGQKPADFKLKVLIKLKMKFHVLGQMPRVSGVFLSENESY